MPWYIESKSSGLYVGEFLGLAFFEADEDVNPEWEPTEFKSKEEAQAYLGSWVSGSLDCKVVWYERKVAKCQS